MFSKNIFKIISAMTLLLTLTRCAQFDSLNGPLESAEKKMNRYQSSEKPPELTLIPLFNLPPAEWVLASKERKKQQGRAIASIENKTSADNQYQEWSNRKLYFMTLLHQYRILSGPVSQNLLNSCPQFHTGILDYPQQTIVSPFPENFLEKKYQINFAQLLKADKPSPLYPELGLSLSREESTPTVFDYLKNNPDADAHAQLKLALSLHLEKMLGQLKELCEYGQAHYTYIFENMISYMKEHPDFRESNESMAALMKLPIYFNMALITSFSSGHNSQVSHGKRLPSSTQLVPINSYQQLFSTMQSRLQADWSQFYFDELRKRKSK